MDFDEQTRELARAHDAVTRLRKIQKQDIERREAAEHRRDLTVRAIVLIIVATVVYIAYVRL